MHVIPCARARRSQLRLCCWFSNLCFRPSNRLSKPTGFMSIALEGRERKSWGNFKFALCQVSWILPVPCYCTFYSTSPSQKSEHTRDMYLLRQMSYDSSFFTATAEPFLGSLSQTNDSLTIASHICGSLKYNSFWKTLPWQLLSPCVSSPCSSLPLLACTCRAKVDYATTNAML